ncbi:MAG: class I SAM-dependent methyltransferase [Burkholderiales bacterium]|nr:class I SAM-dependent methyltransferase [Burkholderiales bacterium]
MSRSTTLAHLSLPSSAPASARAVFGLLRGLRTGTLDLQLPDGTQLRFGSGADHEPRGAMRLRNWKVCGAALRSGDIGFAESFIAEDWSTPDLVALLKVFIANRDAVEGAIYGSWWGSLLYRAKHLLNRNSRRGSRKNIHAHYDLGNAFYKLWLDETMSYSAAWFEGQPQGDLVQAQWAKVRRALQECRVQPGQRLLEIGCGWGGLAEYATKHFDAQVTGVTLSTEQLAFANERLATQGLDAKADLRLQDYRDLNDGPYDAIASIEMFEAVGREYWPGFFAQLHTLLKPGGRACLQTITIRDDLFERYTRSTDFIQQYIFPGGLLPSPQAFREQAERAGLRVVNELRFGEDYAETLRRWRVRFLAEEAAVRRLRFDSRFMRIWEFYLAYCEAAFATGNTDVMQFTLERP